MQNRFRTNHRNRIRRRIAVLASILLACAVESSAQVAREMSTRDVVVHSHHLAFHVLPGRLPALVLDAGGGTDSSYWDTILPELARRTGSEIITYDRAGFGASDEVPPPYRTEDAVTDLESGLIQLGVSHDLVLIPHSFAGIIATYLAMRHSDWVSGAVLIDTNVPEFFTDEEVAHMGPIIQPLVAEEAAAHPSKQTRTQMALTNAYAESSHAFHKAAWPQSLPCKVIVSEQTPFPPSMTFDSLSGLRRTRTSQLKRPIERSF